MNACDLLAEALTSLEAQTTQPDVVVVDNASTDGTREMLARRFPRVKLVVNDRNLGFGKAVNEGVASAPAGTDVIVLVNNDVVCAPDFVECLLEPFGDRRIGMVAGVLLQGSAPMLVDSAGIELDTTLRSWDMLWNSPVEALGQAAQPVGPCGGAAAYRADAFAELGGFDEQLLRLLGGRRPCAALPARGLGLRAGAGGARVAPSRCDPRRLIGCPAEARGLRSRLRARQVPGR